MSITTLLALIGAIETIIQDTPQALALFATVKALLTSGAEPTAAQWASLNTLLTADHAAVQGG